MSPLRSLAAIVVVAAFTGAAPLAAQLRSAISPTTLDDASVSRVTAEVLAGGDGTIVISTTAIIIGLLLIILLTRS